MEPLTSHHWCQKAAKWQCLKLCAFYVCTDKTCLWPGLPSTAPVYVHASVHTPTDSRSILGPPEPAVSLPAGELPWMSDSALLTPYTSFYLLPWDPRAWGPAALQEWSLPCCCCCQSSSVGVSWLTWSRKRGWKVQGPICPHLSLQAKVVPMDGSCGPVWVPSAPVQGSEQPFKRALSRGQLRALWKTELLSMVASSSAASCGVLAVWPQPFRKLLQDGLRGTTASQPPLQRYQSLAPSEPAPAAGTAAQALLSALPNFTSWLWGTFRIQPGQLSVCAHKKVGMVDGWVHFLFQSMQGEGSPTDSWGWGVRHHGHCQRHFSQAPSLPINVLRVSPWISRPAAFPCPITILSSPGILMKPGLSGCFDCGWKISSPDLGGLWCGARWDKCILLVYILSMLFSSAGPAKQAPLQWQDLLLQFITPGQSLERSQVISRDTTAVTDVPEVLEGLQVLLQD